MGKTRRESQEEPDEVLFQPVEPCDLDDAQLLRLKQQFYKPPLPPPERKKRVRIVSRENRSVTEHEAKSILQRK